MKIESGGVAELAGYVPNEHKIVSSNSTTAKNNDTDKNNNKV